MATTTGYIDYTEQTVPASPAASHQRLYINSTSHRLIRVNSSGVETYVDGVNSGTSFPGSPATNDLFYRTDILGGTLFKYDGTRWRSAQTFSFANTLVPAATADWGYWPPNTSGTDIWLVDWRVGYNVASAHSSSNFWTVSLHKYDNTTDTTISTITTDKSTTTWNEPAASAIGALVGLTNKVMFIHMVKSGTPGTTTIFWEVQYQLVQT